jgi:hypothetical protein
MEKEINAIGKSGLGFIFAGRDNKCFKNKNMIIHLIN